MHVNNSFRPTTNPPALYTEPNNDKEQPNTLADFAQNCLNSVRTCVTAISIRSYPFSTFNIETMSPSAISWLTRSQINKIDLAKSWTALSHKQQLAVTKLLSNYEGTLDLLSCNNDEIIIRSAMENLAPDQLSRVNWPLETNLAHGLHWPIAYGDTGEYKHKAVMSKVTFQVIVKHATSQQLWVILMSTPCFNHVPWTFEIISKGQMLGLLAEAREKLNDQNVRKFTSMLENMTWTSGNKRVETPQLVSMLQYVPIPGSYIADSLSRCQEKNQMMLLANYLEEASEEDSFNLLFDTFRKAVSNTYCGKGSFFKLRYLPITEAAFEQLAVKYPERLSKTFQKLHFGDLDNKFILEGVLQYKARSKQSYTYELMFRALPDSKKLLPCLLDAASEKHEISKKLIEIFGSPKAFFTKVVECADTPDQQYYHTQTRKLFINALKTLGYNEHYELLADCIVERILSYQEKNKIQFKGAIRTFKEKSWISRSSHKTGIYAAFDNLHQALLQMPPIPKKTRRKTSQIKILDLVKNKVKKSLSHRH